jgi:hypothetical protein
VKARILLAWLGAVLVIACTGGTPKQRDTVAATAFEAIPDSSPDLGRRADSLAALDPRTEAERWQHEVIFAS